MSGVDLVISVVVVAAGLIMLIFNRQIGDFSRRETTINFRSNRFGAKLLNLLLSSLWFPRLNAIVIGGLLFFGGIVSILKVLSLN
jgi:hypothetical protein